MFLSDVEGDQKDTHIVFLCDASGSMSGDRVTNMNKAIGAALIKTHAVAETLEQSSLNKIDVSAIRFSDTAEWHTVPSRLHKQFTWDDILSPKGITNLGQAYSLLDSWLSSGAVNGVMHRLIVVLITDGMPTDEPSILSNWLESNMATDCFERIAFALGSDAESSYLDEFVSHEDNLYVLRNESMLQEFLTRALTKSVSKAPLCTEQH